MDARGPDTGLLSVSFFVSLSRHRKTFRQQFEHTKESPALFITSLRTKFVGQGETQLPCPFVFFELHPNLSIKKQPQAGS